MNKETLINAAAVLVSFIVQLFISFWLSPFVVGKLGEEAYGFINLANNFVSYASLLSVAFNSMACRFISVEYNSGRILEAKKFFCTVVVINTFLFGIIMIIALVLIYNIQAVINVSPDLVLQVKCTFLLSFLNMGASLIGTAYTSAAFATNKMHYSSLIQVVANIVKSLVVYLLFILLPAKIYYLSIAALLAGFITLFGNYKVTKALFKDFKVKRQYFDLKKIPTLAESGIWVLLSNVSNLLLNGLDLLLSNWFVGATLMGRLSLAKQIPYAFSSALGIFFNIFSSSLTKNFAINGEKDLAEEAKSQLRLLAFVFTVPYALIIAFGEPFLSLWLADSNFSPVVIDEIFILMVLTLIDIIVSTYMYSIHSVFIALNQVRRYSLVLLVSSVVSVIVTIIMLRITPFGLYVIAGTSTVVLGITHAIIVPAMAARMLKEKINIFWKAEIKSWLILILFSLMFCSIRGFVSFGTWSDFLIICTVLGTVGYILSFVLFFSRKERNRLKTIVISRFKSKSK